MLQGHFKIVKYLIDKGADIDSSDKYGSTSLHIAAWNGHVDIVKYLVNKGAKFDKQNSDSLTPVDLAQEKGYLDIVAFLDEGNSELKLLDRGKRMRMK